MAETKIGDAVWAKMKGFPAWPGRVVEPNDKLMKSKGSASEICVYFYGSHNHGWIESSGIHPYECSQKSLFTKQGKTKANFIKGIKEVEAYIQDPSFVPEVSTPKARKSLPETNNSHKDTPETPKLDASAADESLNESVSAVTKVTVKRQNAATPKTPSAAFAVTPTPKKTKASVKEDHEEVPATKRIKKETPSRAAAANHINNNNDHTNEHVKKENNFSPSPVPVQRVTTNKAARAVINNSIDIFDLPSQQELDVETISETLKSKNIKPSKSKFGFIGLGIMGSGIVKNLINSGHDVCVYNRTQTKTDKFEKVGAKVVLTPSDVIEYADITFSCVADPLALQNTMFGSYGISSLSREAAKGKGYVEMTTIDTNTSKDVESSLNGLGIRYLEAQIQGTKAQAEEGKLILLAAGDKSLFEECQTCFEAMGRNSYFVGETGNASKMNLVLQTIAGIQIAGLADAMALADRAGLETEKFMEVLASTNLRSELIMEKGAAMLDRSFTNVSLPLQHMQKDLRLAINMADSMNLPMPVAAIANEGYKNARRLGLSESDASAIYYRAKH